MISRYIALGASLLCATASAQSLTWSNYQAIERQISVRDSRWSRWREIDWRPGLAHALSEAARLRRPVLLWIMNGNPAGFC